MITVKEAVDLLQKQYPQYRVTQCNDYEGWYYCSVVPTDDPDGDYIDNGYKVNKSNGTIDRFSVSSIGYDKLSSFFASKVVYKS